MYQKLVKTRGKEAVRKRAKFLGMEEPEPAVTRHF
jgi:hypothetical protein